MINFGSSKKTIDKKPSEYDVVHFTPSKVSVDVFPPEEKDDVLPLTTSGDSVWFINQYKMVDVSIRRAEPKEYECYEAVLLDPLQFVEGIRQNGYSGVIIRGQKDMFDEFQDECHKHVLKTPRIIN